MSVHHRFIYIPTQNIEQACDHGISLANVPEIPHSCTKPGIILDMCSANEKRRYYVTPSLIGRVHTQNEPCKPWLELFGQTVSTLYTPGESFGDYCTKTRKDTSLSFWCKVYHVLVLLCCKFERDRWSQRGARKQKLLEASGRVGAILTTVASRGCPQCICLLKRHSFR